jgi:hypothetical protein
LSHPAGLCVRHLDNGGNRVQAFVRVNGVEYCEPCSKAPDVAQQNPEPAAPESNDGASRAGSGAAPDAGPKAGADKTLAGRRFHRHVRNCALCRPVLEAEPGSEAAHPGALCDEGKAMLVKAVRAAREGAPEA